MRIPVYYRLLLEFEFAWKLMISLYAHGAIVIAIQLSKYKVINGSSNLERRFVYLNNLRCSVGIHDEFSKRCSPLYLAPLENFAIIKLKCKNTNGIKLDWATPKLAFQITVSKKFPSITLTVTSNNHWMMTNLHDIQITELDEHEAVKAIVIYLAKRKHMILDIPEKIVRSLTL